MTNEEAIKLLDDITSYCDFTDEYGDMIDSTPYYETLDLAIKALEQQPCENAISREAVIDIINFEDEWLHDANSHNADTKIAFSAIKSKISEMPSVTPKAEWKDIYAESEGSNSWIEFTCPHCGNSFGMESGQYGWSYGDAIPWKACPMCGGLAEHKPYKAESEDKE